MCMIGYIHSSIHKRNNEKYKIVIEKTLCTSNALIFALNFILIFFKMKFFCKPVIILLIILILHET